MACKWIPCIFLIAILGWQAQASECPQSLDEWTISGSSMLELLPDRSKVLVDRGYFQCGRPEKGQIVLFKAFLSQKRPLVKQVVAVPGDRFSVESHARGTRFTLLINGRELKTPKGRPYRLNQHRAGILSQAQEKHQGRVPADCVLVFGTQPNGSDDSSLYGLIPVWQLLGRVHLPKSAASAKIMAGNKTDDPR